MATRFIVATLSGALNPSGGVALYALVGIENEGASNESASVYALYNNAGSAQFSANARNAL